MDSSFRFRSSGDRLRARDRVIQAVVAEHREPPRPVADPWYPLRHWSYIGRCGFAMALLGLWSVVAPSIAALIPTGAIWGFWEGIEFIVATPMLLVIVGYLVGEPWYTWNVGLRRGCIGVATIIHITQRPATDIVQGVWEVTTADRTFQKKFHEFTFEADTWVQDLREDDRIRVLVHPTRQWVLLSYGP